MSTLIKAIECKYIVSIGGDGADAAIAAVVAVALALSVQPEWPEYKKGTHVNILRSDFHG